MNGIHAIIFDFDGTLVDLRAAPGQMDALRAEVRNCFGTFEADLPFRPFYHDIDAAMERLIRRSPGSAPAIRSQIAAIIGRYEEEFSLASHAKPFAAEAWRAAARRSRVGVVSNNTAQCVRKTLDRHGIASATEDFAVIAFEDLQRRKPFPDGLSRIAQLVGLRPADRGLYVGDHADDLEACRRFNALGGAQMLPCIVRGGKCDWQRIVSHPYFPATTVLADLSELPAAVLQLENAYVAHD